MVVLDTDTLSHLMRGTSSVVERLLAEPRNEVGLPQPTLAEMEYGLARLGNTKKAKRLRGRFERVTREIGRIDWDDNVSAAFGQIKARLEKSGTLVEDFDITIAAHALAHDAVLITGNVKHMKRIRGLQVESWLK